jgi:hypothetical protein
LSKTSWLLRPRLWRFELLDIVGDAVADSDLLMVAPPSRTPSPDPDPVGSAA